MSLTKEYGDFVVECDICGETLQTNQADFNSARIVWKRHGYRAVQNNGEWEHYCGTCRKHD